MQAHSILLLLLLLLVAGAFVGAQDLVVALDYGTFQGAYSDKYNTSYWQKKKIPFAAPPAGENRFRGPQPPWYVGRRHVYKSSRRFDMCPQREVSSSRHIITVYICYIGRYIIYKGT